MDEDEGYLNDRILILMLVFINQDEIRLTLISIQLIHLFLRIVTIIYYI